MKNLNNGWFIFVWMVITIVIGKAAQKITYFTNGNEDVADIVYILLFISITPYALHRSKRFTWKEYNTWCKKSK